MEGVPRKFSSIIFAVAFIAPVLLHAQDSTADLEKQWGAPIKWPLLIMGADLAKEEMLGTPHPIVRVVVQDNGVKIGAKYQRDLGFAYHGNDQPLRLLASTAASWFVRDQNAKAKIDRMIKSLPNILDTTPGVMHATHIAGSIGANHFDLGVSNFAEIESIDIFQGAFEYDFNYLVRSLEYLLKRPEPVPVLNMSHTLIDNAISTGLIRELAERRNTLCSVAAGNFFRPIEEESALYRLQNDCVIVGSFGLSGTRSPFSGSGEALRVLAPGEFVVSRGEGYLRKDVAIQPMDGTSMSAGLVSGVLANLRSLLPRARNSDIRQILYQSALDLDEDGKDSETGYGLVNALRATVIAKRLAMDGMEDPESISNSLHQSSVFNTAEFARAAKIARMKAGARSTEYADLLRKEILLDGRTERLAELVPCFERDYPQFAFALKFAALNRPEYQYSSPDELDSFARQIAFLEERRFASKEKYFPQISSLSNSDLIMKVAELVRYSEGSRIFKSLLLARMKIIDSKRVSDLEALFAEKTSAP